VSAKVLKFSETVLPGEANPTLVATLEELLSEAKNGTLRALGYCTVRENLVLGTGWDGSDGTRYPLAAAVGMLNSRYFEALRETEV
jgi:hypothetical protein